LRQQIPAFSNPFHTLGAASRSREWQCTSIHKSEVMFADCTKFCLRHQLLVSPDTRRLPFQNTRLVVSSGKLCRRS
jgi:hypothetical protein